MIPQNNQVLEYKLFTSRALNVKSEMQLNCEPKFLSVQKKWKNII